MKDQVNEIKERRTDTRESWEKILEHFIFKELESLGEMNKFRDI